MEIRHMTNGDYNAVYRLWLDTPGMGLNDLDDSAEGMGRYLRRNPTTCFVAVEEERIIGIIMSGHDGRRDYIHHTAVAASRQRRGIGRLLLRHALDALGREGINKVALVAFRKNEIGNRFWVSCGFSVREDLVYRNRALAELTRIDT